MKTDAAIQKDVMDELLWEPLLKASEIGVAVKNEVVTLSGTVNTYAKKTAVEKAAKRVSGVKAVAEDIEVRILPDTKKTDTEIAEAVLNTLKGHRAIPENKIKVKVENGWVYLEGEVEWDFERTAVGTAVENLLGVIGISNTINVSSTLSRDEVKHKIKAAFHRSATVDAGKVAISITGINSNAYG